MRQLFFIGLLLSLIAACDETENFIVDYQYEYFPLEVGKYITYQVDSVTYSSQAGGGILIDTSSYQLREMVTDTFRDNTNRLVYEIERERRHTPSDAWEAAEVLTVVRTQTQLEWTENNRKFIKMLFPFQQDSIWNGNLFFDPSEYVAIRGEVIEMFKSWEYSVAEVDVPSTIDNFTFDSTAIISQANSENLIELRYSMEQYAKNLGLVYKEMKILDTQCIQDCEGQTWEQKAEKGFILRMTVIGFN